MLRVSAAALLLCAGLSWGAPSAALRPSSFARGELAFRQGRYEAALHEMMLVILERPGDDKAREYMRLAAEKLAAQDQTGVDQQRRAMLFEYRGALETGRRQAQQWNGWVGESRSAAAEGRWARSYDAAQRVIEENPNHADAQNAKKRAIIGLSRAMEAGASLPLSPKDWEVYRGLFSLVNDKNSEAREAFGSALDLFGTSEVEESRLRTYLALVTPAESPVQVAAAPAPVQPEPPREPAVTAPAQPVKGQETAAVAPVRPVKKPKVRKPAPEAIKLQEPKFTEEELKARKSDAARLYGVGLVLYGQGDKAGAVSSWKKSVGLDPENKYASRALKHAEQELLEGLQ